MVMAIGMVTVQRNGGGYGCVNDGDDGILMKLYNIKN